ncbi:MAG TPA: sodium-dependent transporter [Ruminococcaceae bacterium]|nr:sodium-dependent transporter [Oscillospiraceae bacterium]
MMEKRNSFSGSIGFVLAAAGSAVGLGNIWRFPYLAAKDGGGLFLVVYLILALTFGFTLLVTEVAIGRKTKQGCLTAYGKINKHWSFLGPIATIVPFMILPYYCIIGGWVLKYFFVFITGQATASAGDDYFGSFLGNPTEMIIFNLIFLVATCLVVFRGVNKGIESLSKVLMPILLFLIIGISIYSMTIKSNGRSGIDGFLYYVVPNVADKTAGDIFSVVMDAMGQLFYSISVAMGIMVTYGSYFKDKDNLMRSVNQIEIFDTVVAFLAGVMIIPAVFVFIGPEGMQGGPGLMFVAMPKIFANMGFAGTIIGCVFFLMVLFAALTSSVSILEAIVSSFIDKTGTTRKKATIFEGAVAMALGVLICLGFNVLGFLKLDLPNNPGAELLTIFDYLSNNILMPIVAIGTCILIGWIAKPKTIIDEATKNGEKFIRKYLYIGMVKVVAPIMLIILFLGSIGIIKF